MFELKLNEPAYLSHFLKLSEDVESLAFAQGLVGHISSQASRALFSSLSPERQLQVLNDLAVTKYLMETMEIERTTARPTSRERNIAVMKNFVEMNGMRFADDQFEKFIDDGDLIEIYDSRAIQIYRNWECFKFVPYSLIELLIHDWNTLFIRPSWVVERLIELTPKLFTKGAKTESYDIPEYVISARWRDDAPAFKFKMKYATPLLAANSDETVAFVTTGQASFVPDLKTGRNLGFI